MQQLRRNKRAPSTDSGALSARSRSMSSLDAYASSSLLLDALMSTSDRFDARLSNEIPPLHQKDVLNGAMEHTAHQLKLAKVKSGIDRRGRTDSSRPSVPSWHFSKQGNMKRKHNQKLIEAGWKKEREERERRTANLKPLWEDKGPNIKKPDLRKRHLNDVPPSFYFNGVTVLRIEQQY